jgi:hypothetical protein
MAKSKSRNSSPDPSHHTGGTWQRDRRNVYFLATGLETLFSVASNAENMLVAVNELPDVDEAVEKLRTLHSAGKAVLLDSGVFNLMATTARSLGVSFQQVRELALDKVPGGPELFTRYCEVVRRCEPFLWGYIELDWGPTASKRSIRRELERRGLRPMPVVHPGSDSWSYFDEVCRDYDRFCCGNIVNTNREIRRHILATVCQRRARFPGRWIHGLGLTISELCVAFPFDSFDSSSWLSTVRWSGYIERACLRTLGHLPKDFQYTLGNRMEWCLGHNMGAYGSAVNERNWQNIVAITGAGHAWTR